MDAARDALASTRRQSPFDRIEPAVLDERALAERENEDVGKRIGQDYAVHVPPGIAQERHRVEIIDLHVAGGQGRARLPHCLQRDAWIAYTGQISERA